MRKATKPLTVFGIEDSISDRCLIRAAVSTVHPDCRLSFVGGYPEAEAAIDQFSEERARPPDVFFVDLHLPGGTGLELIDRIRASPKLASIPIFVLSIFTDAATVHEAYARGASCFLIKPTDIEDYFRVVSGAVLFCQRVCAD